MNLIKYIALLTFFLQSCSSLDSRSPASNIVSGCQDAIANFLTRVANKYDPLRIPKNATQYRMRLSYKGEEHRSVKYLNEVERVQYEVFIDKNGLVVDGNGDTLTSPTRGLKPLDAIYVISPEGRIYISYMTPDDYFQHSSFLSGGDVMAAGIMTFHKGTIQTLSNESGHYQPSVDSIDLLITLLEARKVKIMNVFITD